MNIMHNKMVKFITQLQRMTQHKQAKYPNIRQSSSLN